VMNGGEVTGAPSGAPSSLNWTLVTPVSSDAVAPTWMIPLTVLPGVGSVRVTCGGLVSAGGGGAGVLASTSTVARFHWSPVGLVSLIGTTVPFVGVTDAWPCAQNVSPVPV